MREQQSFKDGGGVESLYVSYDNDIRDVWALC